MDLQITNKDLQNYASKTIFSFHNLNNPFIEQNGERAVSVDVGYGGVKIFSKNGKHCFPALLFNSESNKILISDSTDILYRENDKSEIWYIGDRARNSLETGSRKIDSDEFYSKNRLETEQYIILMRVAIYLGLCKENFNYSLRNEKIRLCTGLPEDDVEKESKRLRSIIAGHHHFQISIGGNEWTKVNFDMEEEDIEILSQPQGTIYSMAFGLNGSLLREDLLIDKNVLVLDGGMFTFDTYLSNKADQGVSKTWEKFAMHKVLLQVKDIIKDKTERDINEFDIEKYMIDPKFLSTIRYANNQKYDFSKDYLTTLKEMARKLVETLNITYRKFNDVDVIIVTGGTGKAYYPFLKEYISVDELMIAESDDETIGTFDAVFSNVIGFYKYLVYIMSEDLDAVSEIAVDKEVTTISNNKVEVIEVTTQNE